MNIETINKILKKNSIKREIKYMDTYSTSELGNLNYSYMVQRWQDIYNTFEAWNNLRTFHLFDRMIEREDYRLVSQREYVREGVEIVLNKWKKEYARYSDLRDLILVEKLATHRLARTYVSLINEIYAVYLLKNSFGRAEIYMDEYLDGVLGVDIVIKENDKLYYIHILKDSNSSNRYAKIKEDRNRFYVNAIDGKMVYVENNRDFTDDIFLKYKYKKGQLNPNLPLISEEDIKKIRKTGKYEDANCKSNKLYGLYDKLLKVFTINKVKGLEDFKFYYNEDEMEDNRY